MDYWQECVEIAFDEAGITATKEQIDLVAGSVEVSHENYGMAFGYGCIPNPLSNELEKVKRQLRVEEAKVLCEVCRGRGYLVSHGPVHSGTSQCWKCRGDGRHSL